VYGAHQDWLGGPVFNVELLPAAHGDSIWIEYGNPGAPRRIVIDGGPASTYEGALRARLLSLKREKRIDLLIVTHIDSDHIDGTIILLREAQTLRVRFGEIWFNAWPQLSGMEQATYQPLQGEFLGGLLSAPHLIKAWNAQTAGRSIAIPDEGKPAIPDEGQEDLPSFPLPDGATLTLLSPGLRQLRRLRSRWLAAIRDFSPGDTAEALQRLEQRRNYSPPPAPAVFGRQAPGDDRSVANGSSIAFLLEYDRASCILAGDAHPRVLAASLRRLAEERRKTIRVDAFKLPHHGSISNVSKDLLSRVECRRWLVSTNGDIFKHPNIETAELIASQSKEPPEFLCNYKCGTTVALDSAAQGRWRTRFPGDGASPGPSGGLLVELAPTAGRPSSQGRRRTAAPSARRRRTAAR
jgi:hypothetical protein